MNKTNKNETTEQNQEFLAKKSISITEAAYIHGVTRQAIYVAVKGKKIKAEKEGRFWTIDLDDLEEYRRNRYSRTKSTFDGVLLFDNSKGFYSINQVAKMLDVPAQKIYYATRIGALKSSRKGAAWVVHIDDVKEYQEGFQKEKDQGAR
jgi:hypothetical protein